MEKKNIIQVGHAKEREKENPTERWCDVAQWNSKCSMNHLLIAAGLKAVHVLLILSAFSVNGSWKCWYK